MYAIKKRWARVAAGCIDTCLRIWPGECKAALPEKAEKVLVCNAGHLGDIVLSTAVLRPLKEAFPLAKIGFLGGSWTKELLENHPLIHRVHIVDHWKTNRSEESLVAKWARYRKQYKETAREIQTARYDLAIDLRFHYPTFAPVLWKAKVPCRIGYNSAGFGPLLTHPRRWVQRSRPVVECFKDLLPCFSSPSLRPYLTERSEKRESFLIMHMGCGDLRRSWPFEKWISLTSKLTLKGYQLIFTGADKKEALAARSLVRQFPNCKNLCNQLSLQEFFTLVAKAQLLIGVESFAGHVAAAFETPSVLFYYNAGETWKPMSSKACVLPIHASAEEGFRAVIDKSTRKSKIQGCKIVAHAHLSRDSFFFRER